VEITVRGPEPQLTHDFLNAISIETSRYHDDIYGIFQLEVLETASVPTNPIKPNKPLNIALGSILGLFLGIGLAIYSNYMETPGGDSSVFNILDRQFNIFNRDYFLFRLEQELSRSKRNNYPLSLISVHLQKNNEQGSFWLETNGMRQAVEMVEKDLREEDIPARVGPLTLAILIPDLPKKEIEKIVRNINNEFKESASKSLNRLLRKHINGEVQVTYFAENDQYDAEEFLALATELQLEPNGEQDPSTE
jgi:GGDEF domain-containing protein